MPNQDRRYTVRGILLGTLLTTLILAAILAIGRFAPTERTMGLSQKIVYVHVAVAWLGLLGFIVMAATGLIYLIRRELRWDHWSQAAGELGWISTGLTVVTGSLWAHAAWGTWWTWEPRLTTAFILWAIYSGYLLARAQIEDPHHRARVAAVLAIVGSLDIPLVVMATRWFRGIHPVSPQMEPSMRLVLLLTVVAFTALFVTLFVRRREQLRLDGLLTSLQQQVDP